MKKFFLLTSLLLTFIAKAQKNEAGIFINPATIDFNLSQGQSGNSKIVIVNNTAEKKQFKVYVNDWVRDTIGKHSYTAPGSVKRSCSNWITLEKNFVEAEPNQTVTLNLKLSVPDSINADKDMKWAMVFLETIEETKSPTLPNKDAVAAAITTNYRIGVHVYQTPPGVITRDLRMLSFAPKENSADSIYRIVCQNTGATQLRTKSYIELSNLADGKKTVIEAGEIPLFPDQTRYIDFVIPKTLPKGQYSLVGAVDGGSDLPLEAAQKTIEIK